MPGALIVEFEDDRPPIRLESVEGGESLEALLRRKGIRLNTRCANQGLCHGCEVRLRQEAQSGFSLVKSCQVPLDTLAGGATVQVPQRSLSTIDPQIQVDFQTLVRAGRQPIHGSARPGGFGLAVDIGTTTVVATLIDLSSGVQAATESSINQQVSRGDNVITRIDYCTGRPDRFGELCTLLHAETLAPLLRKLEQGHPGCLAEVDVAVVAGNTTMLHFMAKVPPDSMGRHPFSPAFLDLRISTAADGGLDGESGLRPDCPVYLLPGFAAFIGADIFAGALSTGMFYSRSTSLLVDVGTNGELLLAHDGKLFGCATAAGPAFEGGGLKYGSRALPDTVAHLQLHGDPFGLDFSLTTTAGTGFPHGICGSAYVDFIASAHQEGLLNDFGRLDPDALSSIPPEWITEPGYGKGLRLQPGRELCVTEADVALILQAKAAIAAGIEVLLDKAGISPREVETLYLAGGFGFHLNVRNALKIGLFPGFKERQVQVVGNTALGGACLSLMDRTLVDEGLENRSRVEIFELNTIPDFEETYIDNLMIP